MIEAGAFYGAVAASSAAIFGVGGGVVATRLVALAERAHSLDLEAGDFLNQSIKSGEALLARWGEKSRKEALADLNVLVRKTRRVVRVSLLSAIILVWLAMLPLIGVEDTAVYRFALLGLMGIGALLWIRELDALAAAILEFTRQHAEAREKRRKELTDAGEPFIVSGDPAALGKAAEELASLLPQEVRRKRHVRKWIKNIGKDRTPRKGEVWPTCLRALGADVAPWGFTAQRVVGNLPLRESFARRR